MLPALYYDHTAGPAEIHACGGGVEPRHDSVRPSECARAAGVSARIPWLQPWGEVNVSLLTNSSRSSSLLTALNLSPGLRNEPASGSQRRQEHTEAWAKPSGRGCVGSPREPRSP